MNKKISLYVIAAFAVLMLTLVSYFLGQDYSQDLKGSFTSAGGSQFEFLDPPALIPDANGVIMVPLQVDATIVAGESWDGFGFKNFAFDPQIAEGPDCFANNGSNLDPNPNVFGLYTNTCHINHQFSAFATSSGITSSGIYDLYNIDFDVSNYTNSTFTITLNDSSDEMIINGNGVSPGLQTITVTILDATPTATNVEVWLAGATAVSASVGDTLNGQYTFGPVGINELMSGSNPNSNYQWYVSSTSGSIGTIISGATNRTYIPTPSDDGKYITFGVQAKDDAGNTAASYEVSTNDVLVISNMIAPDAGNAIPGDSQITLDWQGATNDGATSYKIYQIAPSISGSIANIPTATCTASGIILNCSKTITGLTNGTAYTFAVTAYKGTAPINETSSTEVVSTFAPATPSNTVSISGVTFSPNPVYEDTDVVVNVSATTSGGNPTYTYTWSRDNGISTTTYAPITNSTPSFTLSHLGINPTEPFKVGETWSLEVEVAEGGVVSTNTSVSFIIRNSAPIFNFVANSVPACSTPSPIEDTLFNCNFGATDINLDSLTYNVSISPTPSGIVNTNNSTGNINWTPNDADLGQTFTIIGTATDGNTGGFITHSVSNIIVTNINDIPTWHSDTMNNINGLALGASEGSPFTVNIKVNDNDLLETGNGENMTWTYRLENSMGSNITGGSGLSLVNPSTISGNTETKVLQWIPNNSHSGNTYTFFVDVEDSSGEAAESSSIDYTVSFDITVTDINSPPVIDIAQLLIDNAVSGVIPASEDVPFVLNLNNYESDPDVADTDPQLLWTIVNRNDLITNYGMSNILGSDSPGDVITFEPEQDFYGQISVVLRLRDSDATAEMFDTETIIIDFVNDNNDDPIFNIPSSFTTNPVVPQEDATVTIDLSAYISDPDLDPVDYTNLVISAPLNLPIGIDNISIPTWGNLEITPTENFYGPVSITVQVQDSVPHTVTDTFNITFENVNDVPEWDVNMVPDVANAATATEGEWFIFDLTNAVKQVDPVWSASNTSGEKLSYEITTNVTDDGVVAAPTGSTHEWRFMPAIGLAGSQIVVEMTVMDNTNITVDDTITMYLDVIDNATPTSTGLSITGTAETGQTLTANYTLGGGADAANTTIQWQSASSSAGPFTDIVGATSGTYSLTSNDDNTYVNFVLTPGSATETGANISSSPVQIIGAPICGSLKGDVNNTGTVDDGDSVMMKYANYNIGGLTAADIENICDAQVYDFNALPGLDSGDVDKLYYYVFGFGNISSL